MTKETGAGLVGLSAMTRAAAIPPILPSMIGVAGPDGLGAKELFGEEYADQLVRPGHLPQLQDKIGTAADLVS